MVALATQRRIGRCALCERTRPLVEGVCKPCEKWAKKVDELGAIPSDDPRWDAILRDLQGGEA